MQYWRGNDRSRSQSKKKDDNFDLPNLKSGKLCPLSLVALYIYQYLMLVLLDCCQPLYFTKQQAYFVFGLSGNRLCFGSGHILKAIFTIFYSFEPLCHKPCCHRYPSGISQSSVLSTNIRPVCFQKSLLYQQSQWKVFYKPLC